MSKEQLYHYNDTIDQLQQENKTKDERIAELEMQIKELQDDNRNLRKGLNKEGLDYFITRTNNIRHEICEKIREKLKKCITPACGSYVVYYEAKNVEDVLDKIEQGEE